MHIYSDGTEVRMVFKIYTNIILFIFTLFCIYQSKELVEKTEAKMVEWEKQLVALSNAADKVDNATSCFSHSTIYASVFSTSSLDW